MSYSELTTPALLESAIDDPYLQAANAVLNSPAFVAYGKVHVAYRNINDKLEQIRRGHTGCCDDRPVYNLTSLKDVHKEQAQTYVDLWALRQAVFDSLEFNEYYAMRSHKEDEKSVVLSTLM